MNQINGELKTYHSIDSVTSDNKEEANLYSLEFINSLTPSGIPPHVLNLEVGCIVMLLRTLSLNDGLCNGTRLIMRVLHENGVACDILTGIHHRVLIPGVTLCPSDTNLPFQIKKNPVSLKIVICNDN